jgi:maleylacetoacetate isomerase/maleylpyruvate isomerase
MKLYTYWRSSAAWRVRIALNLKNLSYEHAPVHLVRGEQRSDAFRGINPNAVVPALQLDDSRVLTQSLAIVEYLEERYPLPALLPADPPRRAEVRAAALLIACDIHPLNNLRVTEYLKGRLGHSQEEAVAWMQHWMRAGLEAYQRSIDSAGRFSFGDAPGLADLCLVPQLYNARRWGLDLAGLERLAAIDAAAAALPAFQAAAAAAQPDAEPV